MTEYSAANEVDKVLAEQRDESDARSIINEVEKVNVLEGKFRYRWIWELLQNAKDEAGDGVDIELELTDQYFAFSHNGKPFGARNLLALLRRTSTKPLNGSAGNTGKFGTGFVTTHVLNRVVRIDGLYENQAGRRLFTLTIDRRSTQLDDMKKSIADGITKVKEIDSSPSDSSATSINRFFYQLKDSSRIVAEEGVRQLISNLPFTMLVNRQIRSLKVKQNNKHQTFSASTPRNLSKQLHYQGWDNEDGKSDGLLVFKSGELIIASPAISFNGDYWLSPIKDAARLYKDFPLIGTEDFYIPVIVQHSKFNPTELRDGVRTKISTESEEQDDHIAMTNRECLKSFVELFPLYLKELVEFKVNGLHVLAESGTPDNVNTLYSREWYEQFVQSPLRVALSDHDLVRTVSGKFISLSKAKFPHAETSLVEEMHGLMSWWLPDSCPDKESYGDWVRIVNQDVSNWPQGIVLTVEDLVKDITERYRLGAFIINEDSVKWLQSLISFLEKSGLERLGLQYPIYPNIDGELVVQTKIFHNPGISDRFFAISNGIGRRLEKEILRKSFQAQYVEKFDVRSFLNGMNIEIGTIGQKIEGVQDLQIKSIIELCCTFKPARAERRERWYELLHELIPNLASKKVEVVFEEDYQWEPAEKAALKFVSLSIQRSESLTLFSDKYFNADVLLACKWLNRFYDFVFRNEENRAAALQYKIVPTQDGLFKIYDESLTREDDHKKFDVTVKNLFRDFANKGDPRVFLIHQEIDSPELRYASLDRLSRVIDDLFNDRDAEDKVCEGGKYHELFLILKEFLEKRDDIDSNEYFPIFTKKQPILYVKAFGGSSFSRLLKLGKTVDELEKLDKIILSADDIQKLDLAVAKLGSAQLLIDKAQEMIDYAEAIRWRQVVGKAAEEAFLEAIGEAEPQFLNPDNPDYGRDFVIKLEGKQYSIELKSAVEGRENVRMSMLQGESAVQESNAYALCVVSRTSMQLTNKEDFIKNSRFVIDIGTQIGDKIVRWKRGIENLEVAEGVTVELDSKLGGVLIAKSIWSKGLTFDQFVSYLRAFFATK